MPLPSLATTPAPAPESFGIEAFRIVSGVGSAWLVLTVGAVGVLVVGVAMVRLKRVDAAAACHNFKAGAFRGQSFRGPGEVGTATVEFALCFPILLFFVLLTLQSALVLAAHAVVQRSAASAVRAAVVHIARDLPNEPRNIVGQEKLEAIYDAAWLATLPVSGRDESVTSNNPYVSNEDLDGADLAEAVGEYTQQVYGAEPAWVRNFVEQRVYYAINHTQIRLQQASDGGDQVDYQDLGIGDLVSPRQAIAVLVTHELNLSVPFVRPIFASGVHETADGPGAYTSVWARATKVNQGADTRLPPPPPVPLIEPGDAPGSASGLN